MDRLLENTCRSCGRGVCADESTINVCCPWVEARVLMSNIMEQYSQVLGERIAAFV